MSRNPAKFPAPPRPAPPPSLPPRKNTSLPNLWSWRRKASYRAVFCFWPLHSLMIAQRVRAPQNEFDENSEKYDDWILPWLIQAVFFLANMQLFAIDMCKNDAIRLNGHIIKYIDSIHLINSVRSGSLAKLLKIMWLTLRKAECFFLFIKTRSPRASLSFKGGQPSA